MRKLIGKDVFTVARIIKKSNLKKELENVAMEVTKETDYKKVGVKVFMAVIEGCANEGVENEIFKFLDDVLQVQNTSEMDIFELIELVKGYAKENDLKRFLALVGSTM